MRPKFFILLFVFLFVPLFASASVRINEIAWMGSSASANDELIEIFNGSVESVDLSGWVLRSEDGSPEIVLSGTVSAGGYFLLERTDDESVPGVGADLLYTGALGNSGEVLVLEDAGGVEKDRVVASEAWPAGDNLTKYTMQWDGVGWITADGTPKQENSTDDQSNESGDSEVHTDTDSGEEGGENTNTSGMALVSSGTATVSTPKSMSGFSGIPLLFEAGNSTSWNNWSFGDGGSAQGSRVHHTYEYPGSYVTVARTTANGKITEHMIRVQIYEPSVSIEHVVPGSYVVLRHTGKQHLDVGGWRLHAQDKTFIFPIGTTLAGGDTLFPASILKIPLEEGSFVELYLHTGKIARDENGDPARYFIEQERGIAQDEESAVPDTESPAGLLKTHEMMALLEEEVHDLQSRIDFMTQKNEVPLLAQDTTSLPYAEMIDVEPLGELRSFDNELGESQEKTKLDVEAKEEDVVSTTSEKTLAIDDVVYVVEKPKSWWRRFVDFLF